MRLPPNRPAFWFAAVIGVFCGVLDGLMCGSYGVIVAPLGTVVTYLYAYWKLAGPRK